MLAAIPDTGAVYPLLGRPHDSLAASGKRYGRTSEATQLGSLLTITSSKVKYAKYLGSNFDASTTNLTYEITGPSLSAVTINLSFLSPITPTSTFRQSIPAAYLSVEVAGDFDIDIYLDVNGQWASFDRGRVVEWQFNETEHTKSFKVQRAVQQVYTEFNDRAEWGSLHITGPSDVQYEAGTSGEIRSHFAKTRSLRNKVDDNFRPIMQDEPVFAFAKSFKLAKTARSKTPGKGSALFTIAHIQDQVIRYASPEGAVDLKPLWKAYEDTAESLLAYHYHDFHTVASLAQNYSDQLEIDALQSGSEDYKDILALSARQVMGACSFTGTPKNPLIFYKEISSDGNMNTVDVIYPSFPFFLYTNPRWLAYLLQPLLEHQLSGQYP